MTIVLNAGTEFFNRRRTNMKYTRNKQPIVNTLLGTAFLLMLALHHMA